MADLRLLDLPYYLTATEGKSASQGISVAAVLVSEVVPPEPFASGGLVTKSDAFVVVDLVGIQTLTDKFYVKGRMLTAVPRSVLDAAKRKSSGRVALELSGAAVRVSNTKDGLKNFVSMVRWSRGQLNNWQFRSVGVQPLSQERFPEFFQMVVKAYSNNWVFQYPTPIPTSYSEACEGYEFYLVNPVAAPVSAPPEKALSNFDPTSVAPVPPQPSPASAAPLVSPAALSGAGANLGGSEQSDVSTLVVNRSLTTPVVTTKRVKIVNRLDLEDRSEIVDMVEEALEKATFKVDAIMEDIKSIEDEDFEARNLFKYCATALKRYWDSRSGAVTGRALFKEGLERALPDFANPTASGDTAVADSLNIFGPDLVDYWLTGIDEDDPLTGNKFLEEVGACRADIYLHMLESLLGIRGKLPAAYHACNADQLDFFQILMANPYNLCFIDPRLSVEDLDKLAMFYGVDLESEDIKKIRNVAYLHNYLLDSSNRVVSSNTVVKKRMLLRDLKSGYVFSKAAVEILKADQTIIRYDKLTSIQTFFREELDFTNFRLPLTGWKPKGYKMVLEGKTNPEQMLGDFLDSGLGLELNLSGTDYIADYVFARKEIYIYERLRTLCDYKPMVADKAKVERAIAKFEEMKHKELNLPADQPYKLEEQQRQAVFMVCAGNRAACLTGPAGSGKTTTAEAMVYALETIIGVESKSIFFCGPTGKSANRLKEVVRRKTSTINSLFGIGGESVTLKDPDTVLEKDFISALIVDESSMPNINLLYELVMRISLGTYVFFLGDKEQLPPIGFGKPFVNLLSFLPTVVLNVNKRASENSGVTRNAEKIIYQSDGVIKDVSDYDDFRIIQEKDPARLVSYVHQIVSYHLNRGSARGFKPVENLGTDLHPNDIQIITPINKYEWGTANLNRVLHDTFNPKLPYEQSVFYSRGKDDTVEFRLRDRVMHVKSNQSERTRLLDLGQGSYDIWLDNSSKPVQGINNGETGFVKAIYGAKEIDFERVEDEKIREALEREFRGTENTLFLAVEFEDINLDTLEPVKFTVLYRMEILNRTATDITVLSTDLQYLDLAYALTVHKLQGSQAKLCICLFLPVGGNFLSREMVYTGPTRATHADYLGGDILGPNSCFNAARRIVQTELRESLLDHI